MVIYTKLKTKTGKSYSLPSNIYNVLLECKNRVKQKFDAPILITGSVGSGKTNLEIGLGGTWEEVLWGRDFGLDYIHFRAEKIIEETNRDDNYYYFIGYDEAVQGGSSRDGITKIGAVLRKTLITKRFKGHPIAACVDSLKELNDKIIERAIVWYHVHYERLPNGHFRRGIIKVFTAQEALKVYEDLKAKRYFKTEDHPIWKKKQRVYTTQNYMGLWFTEEEYNKKKSIETNLVEKEQDDTMNQRNKAIVFALVKGAKQQEIADYVGLSRSSIADIKSKMSSLLLSE